MPSASYGGKPSWRLDLDVWETSLEPWNNRSYVNWALYIYRGNGDTPYNNDGSGYGVGAPGGFSGTFNPYRFGGSGSGTNYSGTGVGGRVQIAGGGGWVGRNPDGSGGVTVNAYHNSGSTLGNANIGNTYIGLATLRQAPGTPSNVAAARVSDTQISVTWQNNYPSNGDPQSNQILRSINGGAYSQVLDIGASQSVTVQAEANQKIRYKVSAWNPQGFSGQSGESAPVYTTPGSPTNAVATKATNLDINIAFTENVAYDEYEHEVWHGTVAGGVTTWDNAVLATLASGVTTYTHAAPDASKVHVYRVRAKAAGLFSNYSTTDAVQLLVAPNKPTFPAMPAFADKASALSVAWTHNPVDTTPQKSYEFSYSTNGGTNWTSTGKVNSAVSLRTFAANSYAANTVLTMRVRTWGSATTGGSDGTGASPWSDTTAVTFKTIPVATITAPANNSTINDATVRVTLGFAQAEGATFVKAQLELIQNGTVLETLESSLLNGITLATQVQNGVSYSVRARVQDSNGLWSAWKTSAFNVTYLAPVPATTTVLFLPGNGYGQIDLSIPAPVAGQSAATTVTITRKINNVEEVVVKDYPVAAALTFLDTTPTVNGTNIYTVTTRSALGAQSVVVKNLVTAELRRAYLSKGQGFSQVGVFGANLKVSESLAAASDTVQAAGRVKPIGLYGVETTVQLKVDSLVFEGFGSTIPELRALLLQPGKACYRDASGRRLFGTVKGSLSYNKGTRADLSFTFTETS